MRNHLGYVYGIGAYLCWGLFPIYFMLLADVDPFQVVPYRVIGCMVFCLLLVSAIRKWRPLIGILRNRRSLLWFTVSALLLYTNWQFFVVGVVTGRIIETALGYFINPLVTILIGVLVRREKLRPAQWTAVGVAFVGVIIAAIAYGEFPWIALGLAFSFGFYGSVRKIANENVDAVTGLSIETVLSAPVAVGQLVVIWLLAGGTGIIGGELIAHGPTTAVILLGSGTVTAIPLIFFGAGNRRLKLTHMGFLQFLTPILSFLTGFFIFHEQMPFARWVGFLAVWVAIIILLVDMVSTSRASSRERRRRLE